MRPENVLKQVVLENKLLSFSGSYKRRRQKERRNALIERYLNQINATNKSQDLSQINQIKARAWKQNQ